MPAKTSGVDRAEAGARCDFVSLFYKTGRLVGTQTYQAPSCPFNWNRNDKVRLCFLLGVPPGGQCQRYDQSLIMTPFDIRCS